MSPHTWRSHQLGYFVAVAEEGSFRTQRSASIVSQPSLSQQIAGSNLHHNLHSRSRTARSRDRMLKAFDLPDGTAPLRRAEKPASRHHHLDCESTWVGLRLPVAANARKIKPIDLRNPDYQSIGDSRNASNITCFMDCFGRAAGFLDVDVLRAHQHGNSAIPVVFHGRGEFCARRCASESMERLA